MVACCVRFRCNSYHLSCFVFIFFIVSQLSRFNGADECCVLCVIQNCNNYNLCCCFLIYFSLSVSFHVTTALKHPWSFISIETKKAIAGHHSHSNIIATRSHNDDEGFVLDECISRVVNNCPSVRREVHCTWLAETDPISDVPLVTVSNCKSSACVTLHTLKRLACQSLFPSRQVHLSR